jgi:hypothetical protein
MKPTLAPSSISTITFASRKLPRRDGFNLLPDVLPGGLQDFADGVVPLLQQRGIFRTDYEGRTLREHFGLQRPVSRHLDRREAAATA